MNIEDIWDAFLANDMKLTLRIQTEEGVELTKKYLSAYKHRLYARDPELVELLGQWKFSYDASEVNKPKGKPTTSIKTIGATYWRLRITAITQDKPELGIEIIEEDQ